MGSDCGTLFSRKEKLWSDRQKEFADAYGGIVDSKIKFLIENLREFVNRLAWEQFTVDDNVLGTEGRNEATMWLLRTATNVRTLLLV